VSLEESLRLNPEAPETWLNKGNVLQELGRLSDAVACYHQALRIKPGAGALSSLGVALKELGQIDEALESFNEALKMRPGYPDARNNRPEPSSSKAD
jgi:tetratricopeptide (TPR) repeat protein